MGLNGRPDKELSQKQIGLTVWGNIADHIIRFAFDCCKYYLSFGNLECLRSFMKPVDRPVFTVTITDKSGKATSASGGIDFPSNRRATFRETSGKITSDNG